MRDLPGLWPLRLLWLVLPFTLGPALAQALDPRSRPVQMVGSIGTWLIWAAVVVVVLVPRPVGLTALRIASAGVALVAAWVAATSAVGDVERIAAGLSAVLVIFAVAAPATTDLFVNGAAYGAERRFGLRTPTALLAGPLPVACVIIVAGVSAGPLLLAARSWIAGILVTAVGLFAAVPLIRAVHGLSRRWVVFVPAGLVLHDRMAMLDPVLFSRQIVEHLGPAPEDTNAVDLTRDAFGLVLEMVLAEPIPVGIRTGRDDTETKAPRAVLFSPLRPGAVLTEARSRKLAVATT